MLLAHIIVAFSLETFFVIYNREGCSLMLTVLNA